MSTGYATPSSSWSGVMIHCAVRFYQELNDFLPRDCRKHDIETSSLTTRSVKDLIESFGVPHVEVDLVLANGESVSFEYLVREGDRISVYPVFERLDITSVTRLRPEALRVPRFVADVHLKTLVRRLRMLGFDTSYDPSMADSDLADLSAREQRILLSRDRQLLMRNTVTRGLYVRNTDPDLQAREVASRLDLYAKIKPFARCISCNAPIQALSSPGLDEITAQQIPPGVRAWCKEYSRCTGCGKFYWKGSHFSHMLALIDRIQQRGAEAIPG